MAESIGALRFPPAYNISEWADNNRYLSREASSESGRWDTSRAEYQRQMMDAIVGDNERVVIMSSSQIGKTEIELNIIGYFIDQDPSPILVVYPTETLAKAFSEDRLSPMLRDTPCLQGRVKDPRARDSKNTKLHKMFPGGHITMVGANSPSNLSARPIRVVLFDEVDRFPASSGGEKGEGDVITLASKRTKTFFNRKIIMVSTPTLKGLSRIEMGFEESDKRFYMVPCPGCGEFQRLEWKNVIWDKDGDEHKPETASYACPHCGVLWSEKQRHAAVMTGRWEATAPYHGIVGFHINELYSPWSELPKIVSSFLEAKKSPDLLRAWTNTTLGETWEETGEVVDDVGLAGRREPMETIPAAVGFLFCSADVQGDRIEALVLGLGVDHETYAIEHRVFHGDPERPDVWDDFDDFLRYEWPHETAGMMGLTTTCIDSGGLATKMVYEFVRKRERRRVYAIKGSSQMSGISRPLIATVSRSNVARVKLFTISTDTAKDMLFSRLKITDPGPSYIHFSTKISEEFIAQLSSEKRVIKYHKGFPRREYVKVTRSARNEAIDLFVYAFAAVEITGVKSVKKRLESLQRSAERNVKSAEQPAEFAQIDNDPIRIARRKSSPRRQGGFVTGWKK